MQKLILILFLTITVSVSGQEYQDLSTIKFWTYGNNTGYAILRQNNRVEKNVVDRIRIKDTIYEYYLNGNLKGKGPATLDKTEEIFQPDGTKKICSTYAYNGRWLIYYDSLNKRLAQSGLYRNHNKVGIWTTYYFNGKTKAIENYSDEVILVETYDTLGHLVNKTEYLTNGFGDRKIVEEINYENGRPIVVIKESTLARTYNKNAKLIMFIFFIAFFGRIPINHIIYNRQEKKSNPIIWIPGYNSYSETFFHGIRCMWTFWWFNYDRRNQILVFVNLIFSIVAIGIFIAGIISTIK